MNKPAGQLFQGFTKGKPSPLDVQIKSYIRSKKPGGSDNVYLGIVHRLDRSVTGVVIFGLNSKFTSRLAQQFQDRLVEKTYVAVLQGHWAEDSGQLVDELPKEVDPRQPAGNSTVTLQHCELRYRVISRTAETTTIEIALGTGRRNQIRRQFSMRGHPIVGDTRYGALGAFPGCESIDPLFRPIALHARRLALHHPKTGEKLVFDAPLPSYWQMLPGH